jgi:hypothetical protein
VKDTKGKGEFSVPFGDNQRYDLIIDLDGVFASVQCKTAWTNRKTGSLDFNTTSTSKHPGLRRVYQGEVDLFAVFSPDTGRVYVLLVSSAASTQVSLRVHPARNGQSKRIRMATECVLTLERLRALISSKVQGF